MTIKFYLYNKDNVTHLVAADKGKAGKRKSFCLLHDLENDESVIKAFKPEEFLQKIKGKFSNMSLGDGISEIEIANFIIKYSLARKLDFYTALLERAMPENPVIVKSINFGKNTSPGAISVYSQLRTEYYSSEDGKTRAISRTLGIKPEKLTEEKKQKIERYIKANFYRIMPEDVGELTEIIDKAAKAFGKESVRDLSRIRTTDLPLEKTKIGNIVLSGPYISSMRGIARVEFRFRNDVDSEMDSFFRISRSLGVRLPGGSDFSTLDEEIKREIRDSHSKIKQELEKAIKINQLEGDNRIITEETEGGRNRRAKFPLDRKIFEEISAKIPQITKYTPRLPTSSVRLY